MDILEDWAAIRKVVTSTVHCEFANFWTCVSNCTRLPELCTFLANRVLFFAKLCTKNPELCMNCAILCNLF